MSRCLEPTNCPDMDTGMPCEGCWRRRPGGRSVNTEGIVVRRYRASLSSKAPERYTAHREECRYARPSMVRMSELVETKGQVGVRSRILTGIVSACAECSPELLSPRDASLGVGHIWTAVDCPAYRTLDGADCTCNNNERK